MRTRDISFISLMNNLLTRDKTCCFVLIMQGDSHQTDWICLSRRGMDEYIDLYSSDDFTE